MRVLIAGASGFIGGHLVRRLRREHQVIAAARRPQELRRRFPDVETAAVDFSARRSVEDWLPLLHDVDAVVNAVGILHESGRNTFDRLHHRAPCVLFRACRAAGVRKVIQISALGADQQAASRFHLSKRAADDCLRGLDLDWIVLQPSLVYGPGGASAGLFKALAALPWLPLVERGAQWVQPIYVRDLANVVNALLAPAAAAQRTLPAVGPQPLSLRDMLGIYRDWLGLGPLRAFNVPAAWALRAARLAEWLGARMVTRETLGMLARGNSGDAAPMIAATGVYPRSLAGVLRERPAEQADRWHAGLYFLRPALRIALGLLWLFSGIVSLGWYPVAHSYALLAELGITGAWAAPALYGAALLDIALGLATLARYRIHWIGRAQIALMVVYSLLISIGPAELWLHPFGPVTKNLPLIVATLIMLVLERD